MIKLPPQGQWLQPNTSDKQGSVWASKNLNFDEKGYVKLSPRSVKLLDETANNDMGAILAIGKFSDGSFQVATSSDANFVTTISSTAFSVDEESDGTNPAFTSDSHAAFFHNFWVATLATTTYRKAANGAASATWTNASISLTTGVKHFVATFDSRNTICITNGNTVVQYTESGGTFSASTTLTIPTDYETVGLAYNNGQMGVITSSAEGSTGQSIEAKFYVWSGSETSATGYGVGATKCVGVVAYQSSWIVLTNTGQLKLFNGGGFTDLANLPFYQSGKVMANPVMTGNPMYVEGDRVFFNVGTQLSPYGKQGELQLYNMPSGVWCYDPTIGLYHRASPSESQLTFITVSASGANATTDVITAASGTIPATGNVARLISTGFGGLKQNTNYFVIKVDATTFKLAETKAGALSGTAIDITATNGSTSYFHMYDIVDYGSTHDSYLGALAAFGDTTGFYEGFIFGSDNNAIADLTQNRGLCMTVPLLESRGWLISPKVFSEGIQDSYQKLYVKYRPLKSTDSIVVKVKDRDLVGLPISSPNIAAIDYLIWTGTDDGYTDTDLTDLKTAFDDGFEIEFEFVSGAGAGQTVKLSSISESSGRYTLTFTEDVIGAASTRQSYFIADHWRTIGTITSADNIEGQRGINIQSARAKFVQFKIELRGSDVTIEELVLVHKNDKAE